MVSIYSLITELQSFVKVSQETLDKAQKSNIITKTNRAFNKLYKGWCNGDYDEDPQTLLFELETLLKDEKL